MGKYFPIHNSIIKPGNAKTVETRKKFDQPIICTIKPVGADIKVLAIPITDDKSAYCVAVNFLLHSMERYATKAADPIPPETFSPKTVVTKK